jgi:hypothetical protein
MQYSFIFTSIINPPYCFACCAKIQRNIEVCAEHGIHKRMHEHFAIDECGVLIVAKCPP